MNCAHDYFLRFAFTVPLGAEMPVEQAKQAVSAIRLLMTSESEAGCRSNWPIHGRPEDVADDVERAMREHGGIVYPSVKDMYPDGLPGAFPHEAAEIMRRIANAMRVSEEGREAMMETAFDGVWDPWFDVELADMNRIGIGRTGYGIAIEATEQGSVIAASALASSLCSAFDLPPVAWEWVNYRDPSIVNACGGGAVVSSADGSRHWDKDAWFAQALQDLGPASPQLKPSAPSP